MAEPSMLLPADVRERLSKLELHTRSVVEGMISGLHKSPYHGFSVEFAQHREYTWGDELKHLDWKVFARSDRYYIKQYEEETNLTALIFLDGSESMLYKAENRPGVERTKYEYGALAACALAFILLRQQDTAGLYLFDHELIGQVPPSSHPMTLNSFMETIRGLEPRGESNVGTLFHRLAEDIRRRGVVFFISDFFFPREGHGWRLPATPGSTLPAPKRSSRYGVLGAGATTTRRAHVPAFLPPFPEKVLAADAPPKKRKRGAEDDARDAEALQLALNRIASPPPRDDGGALPLQERLDRAKASA